MSPAELEWFLARFALIPARYFAPPPYGDPGLTPLDYVPFLSNMFLHGGWLHLILNMWTLWLFGPTVEDRLGIPRYLLFYLACGILASVAHTLFNPGSLVPALGASGAISGVLGCFIRLFPLARLIVVVPILFFPLFFEVPAIVFAGLWLLMQVLQGTAELFMPSSSGCIAWWAHVGGFVAGVALAPLLHRSTKRHRSYYPTRASSDLTLGVVHESRESIGGTMSFIDIFWLFFMLSALQPVLRQRMLEAMRMRKIASLERKRSSRVILLVHRQETMRLLGFPIMRYIDVDDSEEVLRAIQMTDDDIPLDIILHTPGGLVLAALQIARAIRGHKAKVTVFVPHYAMSGGTLISLAAQEIVMSRHAVLGPIDPQLDRVPRRFPAEGGGTEAHSRNRRRNTHYGRCCA